MGQEGEGGPEEESRSTVAGVEAVAGDHHENAVPTQNSTRTANAQNSDANGSGSSRSIFGNGPIGHGLRRLFGIRKAQVVAPVLPDGIHSAGRKRGRSEMEGDEEEEEEHPGLGSEFLGMITP